MKRRKLFSTPQRRKLFSDYSESRSLTRKVICQDCGYIMETNETVSTLYCPKCGGKRFNLINNITNITSEIPSERRSLFGNEEQKEFSKPDNEFENKLKLFSGKIMSNEKIDKIFSETNNTFQDLIDKGFAEVVDDNNTRILDTAFIQSKLFSKLVITVTKELDLDPLDKPKEEIIDLLDNSGSISPKGILLIKKAHSIPLVKDNMFSEDILEDWAVDSGILNDIRLEFGGRAMSIPELTEILDERYDDAPGDVLEFLIKKGIVIPRDNDMLDIRK